MAKVIKEELFIVSQYVKWDLCPPCLWAHILQGLFMWSCHLGSSLSFLYWDGEERTASTAQLSSSAVKFLLQINHSLQPRDQPQDSTPDSQILTSDLIYFRMGKRAAKHQVKPIILTDPLLAWLSEVTKLTQS